MLRNTERGGCIHGQHATCMRVQAYFCRKSCVRFARVRERGVCAWIRVSFELCYINVSRLLEK